ncbi:FAD dependent oxidoreductase [Radiomyces spectabilis]|uniref:FAD dependent oxidoreductase n=1 Tax=Radiomyces spectabilis TaxID=64574 RepID=UPI00221FFDD3|nr:FAD dependent oxidoreductase [Radiomyces spectabilis]KAI8388505.1 FAD dependent oxidoreductase [Radiomyces spectabilis]
MFSRTTITFARSRAVAYGRYRAAAVATTCVRVHPFHSSVSPKIHLWDSLPGEETKESEGVKRLLGEARADYFSKKDPKTGLTKNDYDVVVVGAGIIGLATARELLKRYPKMTVAVLEREAEVAHHQTGHNSGVIHAGLYYIPGTLMAKTCVRGADLMYKYCEERKLPVERCGKLIVASNKDEHKEVEKLYNQGTANGVQGLEIIYHDKIKELEPNVEAYSALYSPNTGITNYWLVSQSLMQDIRDTGRGDVKTSFDARKFEKTEDNRVRITGVEPTQKGPLLQVTAGKVITCGGFYADRLATATGGDGKKHRVLTFRGQYYQLKPEFRNIVSRNIYPVPSGGGIPVGVHFTPTVDVRRGHQLIVGPGACITFSREGYKFFDFKLQDVLDIFTNGAFWSFAFKNIGLSLGELYRDLNKRAFLKSGQKIIPSLRGDMVEPSFAGVMAQVFEPGGIAASEYIVERNVMDGLVLNLRNAPSPAATAALAIAEILADTAEQDFGADFNQKK